MDGPNLPETEPELLVPGGTNGYVYPIEGVTGTACRTNYISDGAGGCIYAPSPEDGWGTTGGGTTSGGTTGGSSPSGGGGGSFGEPSPTEDCTPDAYGTTCELDDRPECERPEGMENMPVCKTRDPSVTEWGRLGQLIDRMSENTDHCRAAKAIARDMYAAGRVDGRIRLWDGRNYIPGTNQQEMKWGNNTSDARGRGIELDSYLAFAWETRSLLAHEALHAYLSSINSPMTVKEQHTWIGAREVECAGG